MGSQVSGEGEVDLKSQEKDPPKGRPAFPFIDQGKDQGYTRDGEKEREEKKKENNREGEGLKATLPFSVGGSYGSYR
jgi:hypothetical protein